MRLAVKSFILLVLFFITCSSAQVRINEFMASNTSTLADEDGEYSDWIEIYNLSPENINLTGWSLSDDPDNKSKWIFPQISLNTNNYLVVFASGKNKRDPILGLHTNFKLNNDGEYLALINPEGKVVAEFQSYPVQQEDVSYGYFDGEYLLSATPTPGKENQFSVVQSISPPVFSQKHGFYDNQFSLEIASDISNARIYYTTDGSEPDLDNGTLYNSTILIDKTAIIRAVAINADNFKSEITTSTYLFLDDVINQPNNPAGYPDKWGDYIEISGTATADYEMDPEITGDPRYADLMKDALLQIPTISIVTNKDNLFSHDQDPENGGIYIYTGAPANDGGYEIGKGWERPASVEYFNSNGLEEFQIDCGLEIHGGHSRRPEKSPKHSFRITFREEYEKSKLKFPLFGDRAVSSFNSIVLRSNYGNTWLHRSSSERNHTQLIHDTWGKDTQLDMGNPAGHGVFVHLYLNGMYWGIYNPTERIDEDYCASYFGGKKEDYDIIKDYSEVAGGNITAWYNMMKLVRGDLADNANYQQLQGKNPDGSINPQYEAYLDVENFIDYMLINYYGSNWDWDHHNWIAVRNRVQPGKGFKFFSWDAEHICESVTSNSLNILNSNCPTEIFSQLIKNAEFCRLFADRVQMHCYNGGALTPEAGKARWMKRANEIESAIIAESARWGDYRRDVHRYYSAGPFKLYTKEDWLTELSFMENEFFTKRTSEFIKQLKEAGLFPAISAPQFLINGKVSFQNTINSGDKLQMFAPGGEAYYTIDGSDPVEGSQPSANALVYSAPIELTESKHIKARTFDGDEWSALNEKMFIIQDDIHNLKLTEIHYHPLPEDTIGDKNFEFIELKNTGTSPIQLGGYKFIEGISFTFPDGTILNPKKFVVFASNKGYFEMRYKFSPFDEYSGSLDNSGERIVFVNPVGDTVFSVKYNDKEPWSASADGDGHSLVSTEKDPSGDQNDPAKWRSSFHINGSPGEDDDNSTATNVDNITDNLPKQFQLFQNYPNPFNPTTTISWQYPVGSWQTIKVYDVLGNEVATLVNEEKPAGNYKVKFNAINLPSGVYFYRIQAGSFNQVRKMLLIK